VVTGTNNYDTGLILNRGTSSNKGFVWSEVGQEFRLISTLEQGTVRGAVSVSGYNNLAVASVKLNSETINKVTFTDSDKIVRSLDNGRTAYVDGVMKFNTDAELAIPTGTLAQRPVSPTEGSIRFNSDLQVYEGYNTGAWQGLGIGFGTSPDHQGFIADGTAYQFTLQQTPLSAAGIMVVVNGIIQEPDYAYKVVGNILSFVDANNIIYVPDAGDRIDVRYLSKPAISTIREYNYVGDGSTLSFLTEFSITTKPEVLVFVNNIYQDSDVYSISGNQVIFTDPPLNNERVTLLHICTIVAPDVTTRTESQDDAIAFSIALG